MNSLKKLKKNQKIIIVFIAIIAFMGLVISIPSLARLKNRNTIYSVESWDGTIASSYKQGNGTEENPYIISNGGEFAFFVEQLKTTDYEGMYFELSNDIILNSGIYDYNETEGLKYTIDNITYFVKEYSDEYYDNASMEENYVGKINRTSTIDNFKGNFNGKSFTIYGLYITDSENDDIALFKNLDGQVNDLYISNSVIYGKGNVAGLVVNTTDSTLNNIMYEGFVVNKSSSKLSESTIDPMAVTATTVETNKNLSLPSVEIEGNIKSIKLTGEYTVSNTNATNIVKINGTEIKTNTFEIDLGTTLLNEVNITTSSTIEETSINFSNLKYNVEYYDDISSGIASITKNTSMTNIINKASVYGNYISSGIVGKVNENLQISQSYNTGNIYSSYISSGIVGIIKDNQNHTTLTNIYNKGTISSTLSGSIMGCALNNTGLININNSINASENYSLNTVNNSIVNIVNSYSINGLSVYNGTINGTFTQTALENLYTEEVMSKLSYNKFVSLKDIEENNSNVWIYEKNSLPILYIDDINDPIANINLSKYSWNNLSSELNIIDISNSITFKIEQVSVLNQIKEKYYYITNSRVPMTAEELEKITTWRSYDDVVTINESGYYVIYAKIVGTDDTVTYINTDVLALNVNGFTTNISMDNHIWSDFRTDLSEVYTNKEINLSIIAHDDLLTINSIDYYISNEMKTEEQLNSLTTWIPYTDYITISNTGRYIVYAKIVDSDSNIRYVNTDYIIYNGYQETLSIGNISKDYQTNYITDKSNIKLKFDSDFEVEFKEGYTHNLISNILLPVGTKITLIDNNTNKVYKKTITTEEDLYNYNDSCNGQISCTKYATYKFGEFEQIGMSEQTYYDESLNYNKTISNEKYTINIDFSNTSLTENYYDVSFYIALKNSSNEFLYQTLNNTVNSINIYTTINDQNVSTTHKITSDYANQTINYNSDSELSINFTKEIIYTSVNNKNIIDTTFENKKAGLIIRLYDQDGVQINKKYLDNMIFELGEKEYFTSSDNSIRIDLGSIANNEVNTLKIKTKENSSNLTNGTYYIKINKFISDDGYYYENLDSEEVSIPLVVENQSVDISNYSFDVQIVTESIILNKKLDTHLTTFSVTYSGEFIEPNIRVSLYEKNALTAYNQDYTLIDLAEYTNDTLYVADTNKYFVDILIPTLNLNVIPNKFNNNGYKYVFELYDGTRKISKIEKYFIVK